MGTIIIKKRIAKLYKFNQNYDIIGDFDFILRVSEKFKAKAFNDLLVTIRIHQNNFSHKDLVKMDAPLEHDTNDYLRLFQISN